MAKEQRGEALNKTRLWTTAIAATAFTAGSLLLTAPAYASAGSVTDNSDGTATVTWSGFGSVNDVLIEIGSCSGFGTTCYSILPVSGTSGSVTVSEGTTVGSITGSGPLPAGTYNIRLANKNSGPPYPTVAQSSGAISIGSGGGGGGGGGTSSAAAVSAPVEVSLSLDLAASGASCKEGSAASGLVGTWLALPSAGDCTSKTAPDAKLLGWATTADFPVEIAQRQVRNGWGAYEMFDNEGRMTAVFIPAGQATFVSGSNSLYPIWAR